jgi:hypothetical protein
MQTYVPPTERAAIVGHVYPDTSYGSGMTEQSPAVTTAHPPETLLRVMNPAVKFLLRTPLAGGLKRQMMVLNFKGRKSGRQFSVPVSAHRLDNALYALANAGWTANFADGANADVLHAGKTTPMRGELIRDPATVGDLAYRTAQSYGAKTAQRMMGLKFRDDTMPSLQDFTEAAAREKMKAVKLTFA